jgi:hypothetical protein
MLKTLLTMGRIRSVKLAADKKTECIKQINALNPPVPVTEEDVEIREFQIVGDALTSHGGKFRTEDIPNLLKLINGAPVLVGHDTDKAPIGKFFSGKVEQIENITWAIPQFYWPTGTPDSDRIKRNIDTGVYSEGSIGFSYKTPTCNICGLDIRGYANEKGKYCEHYPGRKYDGEECFYYWDGITQVHEGSIVYRGSHPGTGMGKPDELQMALSAKAEKLNLNLDKKTDKSGGKMKEILEKLKAMARKLDVGIDGLTTIDQIEDAISYHFSELRLNADIGEKAITALRKNVTELAIRRAALTKREVTPGQTEMIKEASFRSLTTLCDDYQVDLDAAAGAYNCPKCGEKLTQLRQSEAVSLDKSDKENSGISIPVGSF